MAIGIKNHTNAIAILVGREVNVINVLRITVEKIAKRCVLDMEVSAMARVYAAEDTSVLNVRQCVPPAPMRSLDPIHAYPFPQEVIPKMVLTIIQHALQEPIPNRALILVRLVPWAVIHKELALVRVQLVQKPIQPQLHWAVPAQMIVFVSLVIR